METTNSIFLQLGDIIQIDAPKNSDLHEHNFLIDYIDTKKIKIIDEISGETITLNINDSGNLSDESISSISILNRAETIGYAKQNNLLPGTFIDIYFGGDIPVTITGLINDLDEDMIEIKTIDNDELIYIDFGYKGIPEDIPIDKIVIRPPPELIKRDDDDREIEKDTIPSAVEDIEDDEPVPEVTVQVETETIKQQIKDIILEADQIEFGAELESITQIVDVPEERKRYGIDAQVNDLLDELLASYPSDKRTRKVLNQIHIQIERFKQLREIFSQFDRNGNATMPLIKGAGFKPLVSHLQKLNQKLYWIMPVAQNQKKIYDNNISLSQDQPISDVIEFTMAKTLTEEYDIREMYKSNNDDYTRYMKKINPYFTPFNSVEYNDTLTLQHVNDNIDAVIDNLGDFYSSVQIRDNIKRKRFLISKYNLGLKKLQTTYTTSSILKTKSIALTNNDTMAIKSFITLPKTAVTFSNINLPATNICDKSNLNKNYISYWKLFRENLKLSTQYIDNIDSPIEFDENSYLKTTTQYLLSDENTDSDKYEKYLKAIIPKTRTLFNMVKKHIDGKLSLVSVVKYLQPFLIYLDDISYKQYEEITEYIENKILEYKKNYVNKKELFSQLSKSTITFKYESMLYKLLKGRFEELPELIIEEYGFYNNFKYKGEIGSDDTILTNTEILNKIMKLDYTKLYNTSVSLINTDLFSPFDFDTLIEQKEKEFEKNIKKEKAENECKQYVLTKRYIDITDLTEDNDNVIYFDKKYDSTVYDILDEYSLEQSQMDDKTFKNFLTDQLIKNIGLNRNDAKYEATSMINGKREIIDGQYAVLEIDNIDSVKYFYYKRENNTWIKDETIPENSFFGTNKLFCNIQQKCVEIDKNCVDTSLGAELVRSDLLKQMTNEFDTKYEEDLKLYKKKLNDKFKSQLERLHKLKTINNYILFKYEVRNLSYAKDIEESDIIISPYANLRDIILGQSDIVKRNNDIVKFVGKYTRSHIDSLKEDPYWLYCIDTNTKLLPTFIGKLASVFVLNGDYQETMNIIKKEQGVNIDNITWDKYSGYMIEKIALSSEEGFDESGYKIVSREILEGDAGSALLQAANVDKSQKIMNNPKAKLINNVITTISHKLGINIDTQRENIINHTLMAIDETVDTQDVYDEKAKLKKKKQTYEDVLNASILTFALSYICIFIAVSVPPLQSKKTFPGCKKSFYGYPITGDEDLSNIEYIACVAASIESKVYPWKALPKKKDKISLSIKKTLDAYILKQGEIQALIEQKKNYLLQNEDNYIPIELDIRNWINFLPPLQQIELKTPSNLSNDFKNSLKENIKTGSKNQFEQINVVKSKIIYFSMGIIKAINEVVEDEKLLLTNNSNVPFLQNACCNTGDFKTIDYFSSKNNNVIMFNDMVNYLYNINFDIKNMSQPSILLDAANTKIKFPPLTDRYSDDTIYKAFIEYCNFNNNMPINEKLISICLNKPDEFDKNATISEKIEMLKKEGKVYSEETFKELINEVNKMNIVNIDIIHDDKSNIQQLRDLLQYMKDNNNPIGEEFLTLFYNTIDSYDISSDESDDSRQLKNLLSNKIELYQKNITDFIFKHSSETTRKKNSTLECLFTLIDFNTIGNDFFITNEDETLYKSILFVKNAIFSFIYVYSNIVVKQLDFESIKIPNHWKLSKNHTSDVKEMIKEIYAPLRKLYTYDNIFPLLMKNKDELSDIMKLVDLTHLYANIVHVNNSESSSILNARLIKQLFNFYTLYVISNLINVTDDISLISSEKLTTTEVDNDITTEIVAEQEMTGEITELDIVRGEQKNLKERISIFIETTTHMICKSKGKIDLNASMIKEKINRAKDKERHKITTTLRDMDKEQRQIENLFKNHRLERWNKGQQKGLTQYVAKTYDEERQEREKDAILERQLEQREMLGQALTTDRDIAMLEEREREITEDRINSEVYSLDELPEDDEYGEDIDDAYGLQFDDNEE